MTGRLVSRLLLSIVCLLLLSLAAEAAQRNGRSPTLAAASSDKAAANTASVGSPNERESVSLDDVKAAVLGADPPAFSYPFHTAPREMVDTGFTVANNGTDIALYAVQIFYISGSGWLSVEPTSGLIAPGGTQYFTMTAIDRLFEGLYAAEVRINYNPGTKPLVIPVKLFRFHSFYDPYDVAIRTCCNRLNVQQVGRLAHQDEMAGFTYFDDSSHFLCDASLILGTSRDNMNFQIFHELEDAPTADNPWKPMYALSDVYYDSTSYPDYRVASGIGCTHDSTIAYTSTYYAPKHPDYGDFYIINFEVYPGPSFSSAVSDLIIAFAADWDVPSDSDYDNSAGAEEEGQVLFQMGQYPGGPYEGYGAALAYLGGTHGLDQADGGFVWENDTYVYPDSGYHVDSLYKYLSQASGWSATDSIEDLNSIIVVDRDAVIGWGDTISFYLAVGAHRGDGSKQWLLLPPWLRWLLSNLVCWACQQWNIPGLCPFGPCIPGDCDGNGIWNVSDAVTIVACIFAPPPQPCCGPYPICNCDADCNCICNISDVVYLISYIFAGSAQPCSCAQWVYNCAPPLR